MERAIEKALQRSGATDTGVTLNVQQKARIQLVPGVEVDQETAIERLL